jgi:hypothetical protein
MLIPIGSPPSAALRGLERLLRLLAHIGSADVAFGTPLI